MSPFLLKTQQEVNAFIWGVIEFYQSLNPIAQEKHVNFITREGDDYFYITFNFVCEEHVTKIGENPSETPDAKWDKVEFKWHKFNPKKYLMDETALALDFINNYKIKHV